jgi:hypothetical protein
MCRPGHKARNITTSHNTDGHSLGIAYDQGHSELTTLSLTAIISPMRLQVWDSCAYRWSISLSGQRPAASGRRMSPTLAGAQERLWRVVRGLSIRYTLGHVRCSSRVLSHVSVVYRLRTRTTFGTNYSKSVNKIIFVTLSLCCSLFSLSLKSLYRSHSLSHLLSLIISLSVTYSTHSLLLSLSGLLGSINNWWLRRSENIRSAGTWNTGYQSLSNR